MVDSGRPKLATASSERHRVLGRWIPTLSLGGLWRHADFRRLWAAQSASLFGSEITALALPLMAVLTLNASPVQMGLLAAAGTAPFLLCSLPAGVWVETRVLFPRALLSSTESARVENGTARPYAGATP